MRYGNTDTHSSYYTYANSDSYCHTNCNAHSDTIYTYTQSDGNTNGDTNINSDSAATDTNSYGDTYSNADRYSYTGTGDSLSTINDDRPYQGSQHAVQFHGTSKRH